MFPARPSPGLLAVHPAWRGRRRSKRCAQPLASPPGGDGSSTVFFCWGREGKGVLRLEVSVAWVGGTWDPQEAQRQGRGAAGGVLPCEDRLHPTVHSWCCSTEQQ